MNEILVDYPAEHIARVCINRPKSRNALNFEARQQMIDVLTEIYADKSIRALIFGGVDGVLSAGGDVPSMVGLTEREAQERMQHGHRLCRLFSESPIPIVTAIEGMGVGNSVGLALLGDCIVMGEDAFILFPFLKLGLIPDWAILRSLPRRVGLGRAKQILMTSERVPSNRAEFIGLVDIVVEDSLVMATAVEKAEQFSKLPMTAFSLMKQRLNSLETTVDEEMLTEEHSQPTCLQHEDFIEGFAAMQERRAADFIGNKAR